MIPADMLNSMRDVITRTFLPDNAVIQENVSADSTSTTTHTTPTPNGNGRGGTSAVNPGNIRGGSLTQWRVKDNKLSGYRCRLEKVNKAVPLGSGGQVGVLTENAGYILHIEWDANVTKGDRAIYTNVETGQKLTLNITNVGRYSENFAIPLEVDETST